MNYSQEYTPGLPDGSSDPLSELGRATTLYHDAPPERLEHARVEYETALRKFKGGANSQSQA
jgi:hypothetical protein